MKGSLLALLLASFPICFCCDAVQAASLAWTNLNGGAWNNATNWSPNKVPAATDSVRIDTAGTYTISAQGNQNADSVLIGGPGSNPTLRIESTSIFNTAFTVANGLTNRGTIEMLNVTGSGVVSFNITSGSLVNEANATFRSLPGTGGARHFNGQLDNRGLVDIQTSLTVSKPGAKHSNTGTIELHGGNLIVTQTGSAPSFTTSGTVHIPAGSTNSVNGGTLNYAGGSLGGGGKLELTGVTLNLTPDLSDAVASLDLETTTVNGPGRLINAAGQTLSLRSCTINGPLEYQGETVGQGNTVLAGPITTTGSSVLRIESTSIFNTTFTVANGLTNRGTIEMLNVTGSGVVSFNITSGSLVNEANATFRSLPGTGGARRFNGQLDNRGLVDIQTSLTVSKPGAKHSNTGTIELHGGNLIVTQTGSAPSFTTSGTVHIPAGSTNSVNGGTLNYAGGSLGGGGKLELTGVTLNLTPDLSDAVASLDLETTTVNGPGRLINAAGQTLSLRSCTINGPLEYQGQIVAFGNTVFAGPVSTTTNSVLRIESTSTFNSTFTAANGLTNNGTIEMLNVTGSGAVLFNVTVGSLVNLEGAILRVLPGTGGIRQLNGQLDNRGLVDLQTSLTVSKAGAKHKNSGNITLTGGNLIVSQSGASPSFTSTGMIDILGTNSFSVTGGPFTNLTSGVIMGSGTIDVPSASFFNQGTIAPGDPTGILTLKNNYAPPPEAVLDIQLGGYQAGAEYDQFRVLGSATLNGLLRVSLTNGFAPKKDDSFTVLTANSRANTFSKVETPNLEHIGWGVLYTATNVVLVISNTAPILPAGLVDTNITEGTPWTLRAVAEDRDLPPQTLTYQLVNASPGMTIDSASGEISWTPTEAQGPSTNTVTLSVTDNGTPPLSDSRTFRIVVREVNSAPQLMVPEQHINELSPLQLAIAATDSDLPPNALRYEIISAPPGLTLDPASGALAWTPDEASGPGTFAVTLKVTDHNPAAQADQDLSATNQFQIVVSEMNSPPVLQLPPSQTLADLAPLAVSATGTDADVPANPLTFELVSGPVGLTVSPSGQINWTPNASQAPSTNTVVLRLTDDNPAASNSARLSVTNQFVVVVLPINRAPALPVIEDRVIDEQTSLTIINTATDPDVPANVLAYTLLAGPTGATISPAGVITWIPSEAQGPSTNLFRIAVTDDGQPPLGATNSFLVTVREVNLAPNLEQPGDQRASVGRPLDLTLSATDPDLPSNILGFSLVSGPAGATIDPASGAFAWTPTSAEEGTTNTVTIQVSDDGTPSLTDRKSFRIVVSSSLEITGVALQAGVLTIQWSATPGATYRIQYKDALEETTWKDFAGDVTASAVTASKTDQVDTAHAKRFYRLQLIP